MGLVKHIIESKNLVHKYVSYDENDKKETTIALDNINITVNEGDFVTILGRNGSGKSTFAKHINALLSPDEGELYIDSMDATKSKNRIPIRKTAGMVFQNPDNQIIASNVLFPCVEVAVCHNPSMFQPTEPRF